MECSSCANYEKEQISVHNQLQSAQKKIVHLRRQLKYYISAEKGNQQMIKAYKRQLIMLDKKRCIIQSPSHLEFVINHTIQKVLQDRMEDRMASRFKVDYYYN